MHSIDDDMKGNTSYGPIIAVAVYLLQLRDYPKFRNALFFVKRLGV